MIDLLLLGTGGMLPLPDRWLSSLLIRCQGELTLFDCGEGTQIPWKRFGWGFRRLGAICLSHTHADHVAGLPGLLHSLANADRSDPVHLFGPPGTARVVEGLCRIAPHLPYELTVRELDGGEIFALPGGLVGRTTPGKHALPCLAYRADLPRARRFDAQRARALGVPQDRWRDLQRGKSASWSGGSARPDDVLGPERRGVALGYVTDTRPMPTLPAFLRGVDLLVCEGTYGNPEDAVKAIQNRHMTFAEAARIARDSRVRQLWLTHFSPALTDPEAWRGEATAIFPDTTIGYSGLTGTLQFQDDTT
ncbi:MAG: ribonuclease Z [Chloroflexota bacterium]|nr:ribonuclease Z [Chloroflexota bacterium]